MAVRRLRGDWRAEKARRRKKRSHYDSLLTIVVVLSILLGVIISLAILRGDNPLAAAWTNLKDMTGALTGTGSAAASSRLRRENPVVQRLREEARRRAEELRARSLEQAEAQPSEPSGIDEFVAPREQAITTLRGQGARVDLDEEGRVVTVSYFGSKVPESPEQLAALQQLEETRNLYLGGPEVTDAHIEHVHALEKLRWLFLDRTTVSDQGVSKLKQTLPTVEVLELKPR